MLEKDDYIFGIRAVIEAIEAGKEIDKVMVNRDLKGDLARELMGVIKKPWRACAKSAGGENRPHHPQKPPRCDCHIIGCHI